MIARVEFSRTSYAIRRWPKQWVEEITRKSTKPLNLSFLESRWIRFLGIDPSSNLYVPFNITNKTYAQNLYRIMLAPLEQQVQRNFTFRFIF